MSSSPRDPFEPNIEGVYVKCDIAFKLLVNSESGYCGGLS